MLVMFAVHVNAADLPKGFHDLELMPSISIHQQNDSSIGPTYCAESVKYHICSLFLEPSSNLSPYLIKEKFNTEVTEGIEGARSKIVLELWKLGKHNIEKRNWIIVQEADEWRLSGGSELVFIKYGCCDSPDKYWYYDIRTGAFLRNQEKQR